MEIIKATNLSKIYQTGESPVYALKAVNLAIEEGSFVAVTGPSGSGKSTLLHILGGLDKPSEGSVQYRDKDLYQTMTISFLFFVAADLVLFSKVIIW